MKVCMFHLMPYRDLPEDFVQRYSSAFIDPPWFDVADADKVGQYYNATLDELEAFVRLRSFAFANDRPLRDVARDVVAHRLHLADSA